MFSDLINVVSIKSKGKTFTHYQNFGIQKLVHCLNILIARFDTLKVNNKDTRTTSMKTVWCRYS